MSKSRLYDYRVMIYSQQICPCQYCEERSIGCHGKCEKYSEYKRKMEILKEENQKAHKKEVEIHGYTFETYLSNTRQKKEEH